MNLINYFIKIIKAPFLFIKYFIIGLFTILTIIPRYIIIGIKFLFNKNKDKSNKEIENKIIPITTLTLSIVTYLLSIFILTQWYVQNERSKNFTQNLPNINNSTSQEEITEDTPDHYKDLTSAVQQENNSSTNNNTNTQNATSYINVNLNYYIQKNPETVGWIQVNGTNINYPIVKHSDNDYYLEHDFYKRKTNIGWIYADYRNNFQSFDSNTIIYGHNLINRTMFGSVPYLLQKNWFKDEYKQYIKISTKTTNTIWQIFSVYKIEPTTDYLQTNFNSTENYQEFLNTLKNRSVHQFNIELNDKDKIITLSTCDDIGTKRVVVHAKLINIENK